MFLSWVVFPLLVLVVSFGCGLLVERCSGWRIPGAVLPGVGLALIIVTASLLTESTLLAPTTPWVIVALAVVGCAVSIPRIEELRPAPWTLALGVCLFGVFAAPIVLSGHPTFAGYLVDGDPAFHFLLALELIAHGHRSLNDLPNDTFPSVQIMRGYLFSDYPLGADVALGALRPLIGTDIAWIYAPFMATFLTFGGLALEELLRGLVASHPLRTFCAFIAAQAGLAYSFYLISSIKELAITWLATLLVVLMRLVLQRPPSARAIIPVAIVAAASLYSLAVPAVPWIGIPVLAFLVASLWRVRGALRRPSPRPVAAVAVVVAFAVAISLPMLEGAVTSFKTTTSVLTGASTMGELLGPLSKYEIWGIWPVGDFRRPLLLHVTAVHIVIWLAMASSIVGFAWTLKRRAWWPAVLLFGNAVATVVLLRQATPYAASKVEAIISISAVLAAMLGAVALSRLWRPAGWALAAVLGLAVLWTNDKSLRAAPLAPQPRFAELSRIDDRFAGPGPVFYNLWDEEYGTYFNRRLGAYEPGIYEFPPTRKGAIFPAGLAMQIPWDPNDLSPAYVQSMRLLVLGRSPVLSRPPANFRLVFRGRYYNVYEHQRTPKVLAGAPITTSPLGPTFRLSCARIGHLAARARAEHARLAYAPALAVASVQANRSVHPISWVPYPPLLKDVAGTAVPGGLALSTIGGRLTSRIRVPRAGHYTVWLEGSITQRISVSIAGHRIGSVAGQIGQGGLWSELGSADLPAGAQRVVMDRAGASRFEPVGTGDVLGSLVLSRGAGPPPVRTLAPTDWRSLCSTSMQWLEIVR